MARVRPGKVGNLLSGYLDPAGCLSHPCPEAVPEMLMPEAEHSQHTRRFFETEIRRLTDRLYAAALRLTRDPDDAEDVVAETVERAWRCMGELRDSKSFEGWLFRILNNTFISQWRRRGSRQHLETELDLSDSDASGALQFSLFKQLHQPFLLWWSTPEERVVDELLREDIQHAIDELPEEFRFTLVMVEVMGHSYREVGEILDVPLGTVRSRLNRARSLLQKRLWQRALEAGIINSAPVPEAGAERGES